MSEECFVPKCKNTVGAPFPRDPNLKKKWLEGLNLKTAVPKLGSIVCFDHFDASCLNENSPGTRPSNRLKRGAIPTIRSPQKSSTNLNDNANKQAAENEDPDELQVCRVCMIDKDLEVDIEEVLDNDVNVKSAIMMCAYPLKILDKDKLPKKICQECFDTLKIAHKFRLTCLDTDKILQEHYSTKPSDNERKRKIDEEDNEEKTTKKIKQVASPKTEVTLSQQSSEITDGDKTESSEDTEADKSVANEDSKVESDRTTISELNITDDTFEIMYEGIDGAESDTKNDKIEAESADEAGISKTDSKPLSKDGSDDKKKVKKDTTSEAIESATLAGKIKAADATPTRRSKRIAVAKDLDTENYIFTPIRSRKTKSQADVDEIEKNMEEIHGKDAPNKKPLEEVQEGKETSPVKSVQSSESMGTSVEDVLSTLEDNNSSESQNAEEKFIKSLNLTHSSSADKVAKVSSAKDSSEQGSSRKIIFKTNSNSAPSPKVKKELPGNIKLPKDIKIRATEKYESSIGIFPGSLKQGLQDNVFLQADNYLFEFGLLKNNIRHLRCAVPICNAHAEQKVTENGDLEEDVNVKTSHNHPKPTEQAKKKQMFLCLMRRKMQTDKTLNIRNAYEEACVQDPEIRELVPLRNVINEICRHQLAHKQPQIASFEQFYNIIETDPFEKLHFTHSNQQFYQEKFTADDGSLAILFGNIDVIQQVSDSKIMCVDASFKIDTSEDFKYQLVTVLVWIDDSYYPILFGLVNKKTQEIFRKIFSYLYDVLAPNLRPQEIITDYEANIYYALAETYVDSSIGGSVFYYTQNLYKKICSLNLSRDLERNSYFRNVYHMLLMLPLLPVNTILDGLNNIELEARNMNIAELARPIFDHVRTQWILNVTPELFCVHKLENRINENVIAPFKKLRDFLLLTKGKMQKMQVTIAHVIEKLIELEAFLRGMYSKPDKKSFGRDLSSFQKKNVLRAWQFIEDHPKIEINNFFSKVLGYIKCMENQLWIWGFYRYDGDTDDTLINASHFSIVNASDDPSDEAVEETIEETVEDTEEYTEYIDTTDNTIVMDAVVDPDGLLQTSENETTEQDKQFESAYLKYVYQ